MANSKNISQIEESMKVALQGIGQLKEQEEDTQLSMINKRLEDIEIVLNQIKQAIL